MGNSTIRGAEEVETAPPTPTDQLSSLIPDHSFYERYISRKVSGKTDLDVFDLALTEGWNMLIEGPTGVGKTSASLAFAAWKTLNFYAIPSNVGIEPSQLFGRWVPDGKGGFEWVDGPFTTIFRSGGVLLINEINFLPDKVATAIFGALDLRRSIQLLDHHGEVIKAHRKDCWCDLPEDECRAKWILIIADMNPDYRGTRQLNQALRNRFQVIMAWGYDDDTEAALLPFPKLLEAAKKLRAAPNVTTPVSTNALMDLVTQARSPLGWEFAKAGFFARFHSTERKPVEDAFRNYEDQVKLEILKAATVEVFEDDVEVDDTWDISNFTEEQINTPGDADNPNPLGYPFYESSSGIYGIDWHLDVVEVAAG